MSIKGLFPIEQWTFGRESILASLPEEDLKNLLARKIDYTYSKGELIFKEDEYPSGVYFIIKGMVKKYKVDQDGFEQILYIAGPGELLGYHAIVSRSNYMDYASALENSTIALIPKDDFLSVLDKSKKFAQRLLEAMSHEFSVMANTLTTYSRKNARERLALQLVVLREKYKAGTEPGEPVMINLGREDLASLVGTARENVIRMLTEMKEENIVETKRRKIIIKDIKRLIELSNYRR